MDLTIRPHITAGVAVAGAAGLIAVTPVVPPPLDLQLRAVQLTASAGADLATLAGDAGQLVSGLTGAAAQSSVIGDILSGGLSNLGMALETATSNGIATLTGAIASPLEFLGTGLTDLGASIAVAGEEFPQNLIALVAGLVQALETATSNGIATLTGVIASPLEFVGTGLTDLGTSIAAAGGAVGDVGTLVSDLSGMMDPAALTSAVTLALDPAAIA
ncbi:MAG TPA: hypothetical protein VE197_02740, partial [Mycobacterium sp.]|nr:hypothetical protein [Mycobacterium sp.]